MPKSDVEGKSLPSIADKVDALDWWEPFGAITTPVSD